MTDTCSSCYYGRMDADGITLRCCYNAPSRIIIGPDFPGARWPQVPTAGWCGDGADNTTGRAFGPNTVMDQIYTVATLPTLTASQRGTRAWVSDAKQPSSVGSTNVGGGSMFQPTYWDGGQWLTG